MLVSYRWLCEIAGFEPDPEELSRKLTFSGLEVDEMRRVGGGLEGVVVGKVVSREPHPKRDRLSCVVVDSGNGQVPVVCGAANCPGPGGRVVLARVGATVGEMTIEPRELAGARSEGMLCSEEELDIGPDGEGIMILDGETDSPLGTPIAEALDLDDWIYELGVTPNRPDALSHRGIAREMCLLFGESYEPSQIEDVPCEDSPVSAYASVDLQDSEGCPRYACAVMRGMKVAPSPFGLRYRLHNLGVRPISNLVDATNLILLEWGQPLHAFDLERVTDNKIVVRRAGDGEKMTTLDEIERSFVSDDVLICDGSGPVAIGGVMGGQDTGIGDTTSDVLIECAYFSPTFIRRTSKRLKLSSESSYRFERGVDPNGTEQVLAASMRLMYQLAGGTRAEGIVDCYPAPVQPMKVKLRPARYEKLMGYGVDREEMRRILTGLGASVSDHGDDLLVDVPTGRPDIEREVDLIEEIARVSGLDRIPVELPRIQSRLPDREEFEAARRAKDIMCSLGLDEAITYSFVSRESLAQLGKDGGVVNIANPLNSERASMRTTLVAGLLESLKRAGTRYEGLVRQFEVGRVFEDTGGELPREELMVSAVLSGPRDGWLGENSAPLDYYDAKGIAEAFVEEICGVSPVLVPTDSVPFLHPRRAAHVKVGDNVIGVVGEIHPSPLAAQKVPRGAVCMELSVTSLWESRTRSFSLPLSEFPPMTRDVALLVEESQDAGPILEALQRECGDLAVSVSLFDIYRGKGIKEGKKSLAFSVTYRSWERTLTDEEIDTLHRNAISQVQTQFKVSVR